MNHRVIIVGEAPNTRGFDKYNTQSGQRLLKMAGEELPWHNVYETLPEKWEPEVARERIRTWLTQHPYDSEPLILLGRKVQAAFDIYNAEWLSWWASPEHRHPMIIFPHTSGRVQWWNDEKNMATATELLQALVNGSLPYVEHKNKREDV